METFIYITKSIAILSIFYVIYRIVLQKDTFFSANRHYLLSGIIAAFIVPFIQYTHTTYRDIPILDTSMMENTSFVATVATSMQPPQEAIIIDWWEIALIIYGIGFVVMISRLGIQLISLHKLIAAYPKVYKDGYNYVQITDKTITPFSFFKTICYNPNLHTPKELDMILAHEKIHVRQRHTIDILLTQCILAIQWLNPLAWLYKESLEQNLEFIADNGAIQEVSSSQEYQRTLVKVSSTVVQPALTNNFYHSLIKKRIVMLQKSQSKTISKFKYLIILPVLLAMLTIVSCTQDDSQISAKDETAAAKKSAEQIADIKQYLKTDNILLDCGTGYGRVAKYLLPEMPLGGYVGVDSSYEMLTL
ncbi:M56 family metallopeptidase, partial [uncultured Dokdonia sp.]|uniref:M56 family metallopeptidase n=1 Tax=uncultured Dokdonia sp. TaxID=575653 RepID=UPI00263585DD